MATNLKEAGNYASYCDPDIDALVHCLLLKVEKLEGLLDTISAELELSDEPMDESPEAVSSSIKCLLKQDRTVSATRYGRTWEG